MAQLKMRLLGPIQYLRDEEPLSGFDSDKVRALLAYLAMESESPHRREFLAGLLWPEYPERSARTNLRRALANLRGIIGDREARPPFLNITRQNIQFNHESDYWLDTAEYAQLTSTRAGRFPDPEQIETALELSRGEFMEGFTLADCAAFEEWLTINREATRAKELQLMSRLATHYEGITNYERAIHWANQQVALDPYQEQAHRQLMRVLTLSGRRSDALLLYEESRRILQEELGVEPTAETQALYEQIRSGELTPDSEDLRQQQVRGYELRERLGAGRFGVVYRAYQPVVHRDVAIKIILSELANNPSFIRRFEAEAQIIARLEHPHIVPLYDYWREPLGAYLVMRWLRGGSLQADLIQGPWKPEAAASLVRQISAALSCAHRQGIVHRDIKPANILLDDERIAYLSDFGIATMTSPFNLADDPFPATDSDYSTGSLEYLSPETVSGHASTPAADIYSLGIVIYELLIGQHPFAGYQDEALIDSHLTESLPFVIDKRPDVPGDVDEIIQKATAKEPANRYQDALELAADFQRALRKFPKPMLIVEAEREIRNPYKGLRAFQEADRADFYGREAAVDQILNRMREDDVPPFLAVVGPSGSGKSSLVKAGLIPVLRQGALPSSQDWFYLEMTPAAKPFEQLESALLRIAVNPPESLLGQLREDRRGVLRAVRRSLPDDNCVLFLVVDQFEELFTSTEAPAERELFMKGLVAAVQEEHSPIYLILTLRADFFDRPLQYSELGHLLKQRSEVILPLSAAELERVVIGPATQVSVGLEPGLLAEILTDVTDQPGTLPLLQYALTEVFEQRENSLLTREAYRSSGGVLGALGSRAETLYQELDERDRESVRQLFLRLVQIGEGGETTKRKVLRSELETLASGTKGGSNISAVIDIFGRYRLLTFDRDPESRAPTVEIAHEALIEEWQRLRQWIDGSREDLLIHRRLASAAAEWNLAARDPGYLLRGSRLDRFAEWEGSSNITLIPMEQDFLDGSLTERSKRQEREKFRLEREEKLERRSRNFLRVMVAVLALAAAISLLLAGFAVRQRDIAQEQVRISSARELAKAANENLSVDPELSILLALEAVNQTYEVDSIVMPEAEEVLHQAIQADRLVKTITSTEAFAGAVFFSPDGKKLITWFFDDIPGNTRVFDSVSGEELLFLPGVVPIRITSEEGHLVTGQPNFATFQDVYSVWNLDTGEKVTEFTLPFPEGIPFSHSVDDALNHVVRTVDNGITEIWDLEAGPAVVELVHEGQSPDTEAKVSPDGERLATANFDGTVYIYSLDSGELLHSFSGHIGPVLAVEFTPDGRFLASAGADETAKIWDVETGEMLVALAGHSNELEDVSISPKGNIVATAGWDRTIRVWDLTSSLTEGYDHQILTLTGHDSRIVDIDISKNENYLASASQDGSVKLWDISPQGGKESLALINGPGPGTQAMVTLSLSPDGTRLAAANADLTPRVWDTITGDLLYKLVGHQDSVEWIEYSPDGELIATAGHDDSIRIWDALNGNFVASVDDHNCSYYFTGGYGCDLVFSPDGRRLAIVNADGILVIFEVASLIGEYTKRPEPIIEIIDSEAEMMFDVSYSPDGNKIVSTSMNYAKVWDANNGELLHTLRGHSSSAYGAVYSPDGKHILTTSADETARIWDAESGELLKTLLGHSESVLQANYSRDGQRIATASTDGSVKLWDAQEGEELLTLRGHASGVGDVAFSPDGRLLYTASHDGTNRVFLLEIEELIALAKLRVSRALSKPECQKYLHVETCPEAVQ